MDIPTNLGDVLQLRTPAQDLQKLSFCPAQPKKIQEWVSALPMVNVGESAKQLYSAVQEINRLQTDPVTRFQMLEMVRPALHYICNALGKHYLNQPVILPEKASKVANLAQALQNHFATGYKIVVLAAATRLKEKEMAALFAQAIHRAISDMTQTLVRCYQLYFQTPTGLWYELNRLYLAAEVCKITNAEIKDSELKARGASTILEAYLRAVMLATSRPEQLRQSQISQVYLAAEEWVKFTTLTARGSENALFAVDQLADFSPKYPNLLSGPQHAFFRFIDISPVSDHLRAHLQGQDEAEKSQFPLPRTLTNDLLRHLIQAWAVLAERSFKRIDESGSLQLCIGLSATHYFISGQIDFDQQTRGSSLAIQDNSNNPFLARKSDGSKAYAAGDAWSHALTTATAQPAPTFDKNSRDISYDISKFQVDKENIAPAKYDIFECKLVNSSPGGFCVQWTSATPSSVKTGEIIAVRESERSSWAIAVIRWVKQFKTEGTRMGIELLAPKATPSAVRVIQKTGDMTEYMRALVLPELRAIGQPATLITPSVPFQVGHKILCTLNGEELKGQLTKLVTNTASISQFQFKLFGKKAEEQPQKQSVPLASTGKNDDDFDSLWTSL